MSQHPSLRSSDKDKQHRSVLKRYERLKILKEKEMWKDEESVFGLPKVKVQRFKIKKEKAAAAVEGAEAKAAAPGQEAAPSAVPAKEQAKPGAQAKAAQPKETAKPKGQEGKKIIEEDRHKVR